MIKFSIHTHGLTVQNIYRSMYGLDRVALIAFVVRFYPIIIINKKK